MNVCKLIREEPNRRILNSNAFWKIRKKLVKCQDEEYESIDKDGNIIKNPEEAKKHIAKYLQELYHEKEGEPSHQDRTKHINDAVNTIEQATRKCNYQTIKREEIDQAIKQLKRNKSCGPDNIPNEVMIESNDEVREIITEVINNVYIHENIPKTWLEGETLRLYKYKETKGKCSNERGITLGSNIGKLCVKCILYSALEQ